MTKSTDFCLWVNNFNFHFAAWMASGRKDCMLKNSRSTFTLRKENYVFLLEGLLKKCLAGCAINAHEVQFENHSSRELQIQIQISA